MSTWQGRVSESVPIEFWTWRAPLLPAVRKFSSTCRFLAFSSKQESLRRRRLDSAPHPILRCGRPVKRMPFRQRQGSNNRGRATQKCSQVFHKKNRRKGVRDVSDKVDRLRSGHGLSPIALQVKLQVYTARFQERGVGCLLLQAVQRHLFARKVRDLCSCACVRESNKCCDQPSYS